MVCDMSRFYKKHSGHVALAGQTGGAIRVVLDFLFLLYQDKRKVKKMRNVFCNDFLIFLFASPKRNKKEPANR